MHMPQLCLPASLACPSTEHVQRLRADFRTPATRRECRAAVASDVMTTRGTAELPLPVLSSLPTTSVRRLPLSMWRRHVAPRARRAQ